MAAKRTAKFRCAIDDEPEHSHCVTCGQCVVELPSTDRAFCSMRCLFLDIAIALLERTKFRPDEVNYSHRAQTLEVLHKVRQRIAAMPSPGRNPKAN